MIFQHTIDKVLSGEKTQTRRIVKPGECDDSDLFGVADSVFINGILGHKLARTVYKVGKTYAVQPGRGKKAVARICILKIWREDVRAISREDVKAEGFKTASDFFITWVKMHDKSVITPIIPDYHTGEIIWQGVHDCLSARPAERYDAWAIEFEVVK